MRERLGASEGFIVKSADSSRQFDGAVGNVWYEAKSGNYWLRLQTNPKALGQFRERMGSGLKIARERGAHYELYSNSPIPGDIKSWLTKNGIPFKEFLEGS